MKPPSSSGGTERPLKPPVTESAVSRTWWPRKTGEGGHAEVDALDPPGDGAEQAARGPGEQHGEDGGDGRQSRPGFARQPDVAVGADGEEEGVAEGELAAVPLSRLSPTAPMAAAMENRPMRSQNASR